MFGRGSVTTYVLLGMGERPELILDGCRRAIEMGVYPFVVPLRPVPGTLMADAPTPDPDYVAAIYQEVLGDARPTPGSTTSTPRRAARAARPARASPRGSASSAARDGDDVGDLFAGSRR